MSWDCCNPAGQCQQGPGCPAGAGDRNVCRSAPEATIARVARIGKRKHALHMVTLDKDAREAKGLSRALINWIEAMLLLVSVGLVVHAIDPMPQCAPGDGAGCAIGVAAGVQKLVTDGGHS